MYISELLDVDRACFANGCLSDVLGDAFLIRHNPVYALLRKMSLKCGFRYVQAWPEYQISGLLQLDRILRTKQIPTKRNRPVLEGLNKKLRDQCNLQDIPAELENFQMHESAHGVADFFVRDLRCGSKDQRILKAMLCESFANASESMATAFAIDAHHRTFLNLNCYIRDSQSLRKLKMKYLKQLGGRNLFLILLFSYLYSNYLYEKVSIEVILEVIQTFGESHQLSKKQLRELNQIISAGLGLNIRFRTRTLRFYLLSQGMQVSENILDSVDFDFMEFIARRKDWSKVILAMSEAFSKILIETKPIHGL